VITVSGKTILTELPELIDPVRAALVIVDMQRDFIEPDGLFGQLGIDLAMYQDTRPKLSALLDGARRAGLLIVHIQNTALPDRMSDSPAQIRFNLRMHEKVRRGAPPPSYTVPGTPGHAFVDEFIPRSDELVVRKYRSSAFWGTNLDLLLGSNGIETVIIAGCTTEGCVESTARDALFSDYYVVVAYDCVGSDDPAQHAASMLLMQHRFDLASSEQITQVWDAAVARLEVVPQWVS